MEPKVVNKGEKWLVFGFFGATDALQVILSLFVVGEVVNHFIDIAAGIVLFAYGLFRRLWTGKKLAVLLATFVGEQIPFVNALPFWTLDVANLFSGTITSEQKESMEQERTVKNTINQPLYVDGSRAPRNPNDPPSSNPTPSNQSGIRAPGGGLQPAKTPMVDIKPPVLK